jgi:hypothetical protein
MKSSQGNKSASVNVSKTLHREASTTLKAYL